jgi:hypothetical protein
LLDAAPRFERLGVEELDGDVLETYARRH